MRILSHLRFTEPVSFLIILPTNPEKSQERTTHMQGVLLRPESLIASKMDLNQASLPWSISQAIRDEQGFPVRSTDVV